MANKFNFEFNLSHKSITNLIQNLKNYEKELKNSKKYILKALAEYTEGRVKYYIEYSVGLGGYPITNTLLNSIQTSQIIGDMVRVYTDLAYAKFVEFGTGVTGQDNPNPKATEFGWTYDKNKHGKKGWTYKGSDGAYYWTEGQEAHNFMYNAYLDLKENYMEITKEVLRERGLIK